eukprot:TRINITY_DN2184_c0_g1_i1.p1 TRINITY_DN2184_c0_g1~~TRINITY_DN2184_c0_g1_i1.p1  ORF type:complete len:242 (-),score=18.95 TRINITY_DN2184_c0_g1_i1:313-966(-)
MNFKYLVFLALSLSCFSAKADELCTDCQTLVEAVVTFVTNAEIQEAIQGELDAKVCGQFQGEIQQTCQEYVQALVPSLFEYLKEEVSPLEVCTTARVCSGTPSTGVITTILALYVQKAHENLEGKLDDSNGMCEYCELAVGEVHELIANPEIQQNIVKGLTQLCAVIPFVQSDECTGLVEQYAQEVFSILEQYLMPEQLCMQLGFCAPPAFSTSLAA